MQYNCSVKVLRAYQTELDLNNAQRSACARQARAARFAYNWGLEQKQAAYQAGQKVPTAIDPWWGWTWGFLTWRS